MILRELRYAKKCVKYDAILHFRSLRNKLPKQVGVLCGILWLSDLTPSREGDGLVMMTPKVWANGYIRFATS